VLSAVITTMNTGDATEERRWVRDGPGAATVALKRCRGEDGAWTATTDGSSGW